MVPLLSAVPDSRAHPLGGESLLPAAPVKGPLNKERILEGYAFREQIGEGGFSEVYRAVDLLAKAAGGGDVSVAVKVASKLRMRPHDQAALAREVTPPPATPPLLKAPPADNVDPASCSEPGCTGCGPGDDRPPGSAALREAHRNK
jgi:serine/threonine protein kinase